MNIINTFINKGKQLAQQWGWLKKPSGRNNGPAPAVNLMAGVKTGNAGAGFAANWEDAYAMMMGNGGDSGGGGSYGGGGGGGYGGGGYGGGGGGGGYSIGFDPSAYIAAKDAAVGRVQKYYGDHVAQFDESLKNVQGYGAAEQKSSDDRVAAEKTQNNDAYLAAMKQRTEQRKVLGIQDAASVNPDSLATSKTESAKAIADDQKVANTRIGGHKKNDEQFVEDLRGLTKLEGENAVKDVEAYWYSQLAQARSNAMSYASRSMGGGGGRSYGGGYRSYGGGGGGASGGGGGISTYVMNAANAYARGMTQSDQFAYNNFYKPQAFAQIYKNTAQIKGLTQGQRINLTSRLVG